MKVISIRQPWAWLICAGIKDVENREWSTRFRGRVLIHAGKFIPSSQEIAEIEHEFKVGIKRNELHYGGIVGEAEITDCVERHDSPWFFGAFGFLVRNARHITFFPCTGKLGFFDAPKDFNENAPVNVAVVREPELL